MSAAKEVALIFQKQSRKTVTSCIMVISETWNSAEYSGIPV
jgi:hypothetical protein